ncbi:SAYSvFN domain-containing protein 1 [Hondaea fermentalgiana]|uniref:SAYSvFN domain-containing protein 1 n=1 Tax=Hondaea fermentalgiana TaxID=2315210 RepID=A0A2R5GNU0_9STRA|nr:SAYSvFN domain-containing protein 1 [Hondaea fermentalgiana]|eukprot:GBG30293.1 SAYSvFN domain-containing protein 1 [Hondaea fermentalgiana]
MEHVRRTFAKKWPVAVVGCIAWYFGLRQAHAVGHDFGGAYVYVLLTVVIAMYMNFEPRREGTLSGYSLFNANGERIAGSLTADEIDNQMRSGTIGATTSGQTLAVPKARRPLGPGRRLGSASEYVAPSEQPKGLSADATKSLEAQRRLRQQRAAAAALRRREQPPAET